MLGLPGFRVLSAAEVDGELEVTVETTAVRTGCRECGVIAELHDRRETVVRDVDAFDRRVRLRWRKRVWRCPESACPARTWTERSEAIRPRASLTERALPDLGEHVLTTTYARVVPGVSRSLVGVVRMCGEVVPDRLGVALG